MSTPRPSTTSSWLTVPNLVSFVRLLTVPVFWWVLLGLDRVALAAVIIILVGGTDWIDGYLARRLNQVSEVGIFLDPLADRLMIASAVVGGLIAGVVPLVLGLPLVARELGVGIGALVITARGGGKVRVRELGKTATFLLYGAIPSFYLTEAGLVPWLFGPIAWIAGVVGLVLYYWVAVVYLGEARRASS